MKLVQQLFGGQEGQIEGTGGSELVSCSLKLTTLFLGMVKAVRAVRQCTAVFIRVKKF